jgi:UDP-glucose 4-epimerase
VGFDPEGAVLVTGICGRLGKALAQKLHRDYEVIGIDRRPFPACPKDIKHYQIDIRRRKVEEIFAKEKIRAVIHMAIMHDPRMDAEEHHSFNVMGTRSILSLCKKYGISKVVVLSSANVYGPRADNTQFITEDMPLMAAERFGDIRDLVMVDMYASTFFWKHPDMETVILRPVHIVGDVHNAPSNYLRLKHPPVMLGYDPMVQLIHQDDCVRAMILALRPEAKGVYNVVGPDPIPLRTLLKAMGKKFVEVPEPLFRKALEVMFRMRLTSFPPPEIDHLMFVCMVDGQRFVKDFGFSPSVGIRDIVEQFKERPGA